MVAGCMSPFNTVLKLVQNLTMKTFLFFLFYYFRVTINSPDDLLYN